VDAFASYAEALCARDPLLALTVSFLAEPERRRLLATLALHRELRQVALAIAEPEVAQRKLGWWMDELDRAAAGNARHPITQALGRLAFDADQRAQFAPALDRLRQVSAVTDADALDRLYAPLVTLEVDHWRAPVDAAARRAIGRLHALHDAPAALDAGRLLLPLDRLAARGLSRANVRTADAAPALDRLVKELASPLRPALKTARGSDRVGALYLKFLKLRAQELTRTPGVLFGRAAPRPSLRTPLALWWTALRVGA
jgi:phytoene/squalene synthetase